ncbi:hypothetical protein KCP75_08195 [Salmonella enterica subsp. enterica]|nr:hypothetical protein KCP75_08195 [Salmonella enterica subsp. enterica]
MTRDGKIRAEQVSVTPQVSGSTFNSISKIISSSTPGTFFVIDKNAPSILQNLTRRRSLPKRSPMIRQKRINLCRSTPTFIA